MGTVAEWPGRLWRCCLRYKATLGFLTLAAGVVLSLYIVWRHGQDRQSQIDEIAEATAYICETTKIIDSATLQLHLIDLNSLGDPGFSPAERERLRQRVEVLSSLHDALLFDEPCTKVE